MKQENNVQVQIQSIQVYDHKTIMAVSQKSEKRYPDLRLVLPRRGGGGGERTTEG